MPRRVDPFNVGAWDEAGPGVRKVVSVKAGRPELQHVKAADLTAESILVLATAAGMLSWLFSELEAMAPFSRGDSPDHERAKRLDQPLPKITLQ